MHIETDLDIIQQQSIAKQDENDSFRQFVRVQDTEEIDKAVHALNNEITPQINCLECGNCCRSLMINVEPGELKAVADHLQITESEAKEKYIETSVEGEMLMNVIPCAFLSGNACTVYESRFSECREFPHLHKPQFRGRLFGTLMHYGRCPIIYNVMERLKIESGFIATQ